MNLENQNLAPISCFFKHAQTHPADIALVLPGRQITYGDLADSTMHWCQLFQEREVSPGAVVGLALAAPGDFITGCLAAHCAGAAFMYLPVSTGHLWTSGSTETATAFAVVDHKDQSAPGLAHVDVAEISSFRGAGREALSIDSRLKPTGASYYALTSGTLSNPKVIAQSNNSFCGFLRWQARIFNFRRGSNVAMWAPLSFDACYTEIFGALSSGATLIIPDYGKRRDPAYIAVWLVENGVDYFLTVPSFLHQLVHVWRDMTGSPRLKYMAVSGEKLDKGLAMRFLDCAPTTQLHNLYGPSETILASHAIIKREHCVAGDVPIGHPIDGRTIRILDEEFNEAPIGTLGEIGIVISRGTGWYVAADANQRARFVENCCGLTQAEILFRTGDFGWRDDSGTLYFKGRRDSTVKIQGHLVDTDVVENEMLAHPQIYEGVVFPLILSEGITVLVGNYVSNSRVSTVELREFLTTRVTPASVPSLLLDVPALPRTHSGKIDRARLQRDARKARDKS